MSKAKTLGNLPEGFVTVIFGDDNGKLNIGEGKGKDKRIVRVIENVLLPVPISAAAQKEAGAEKELVLTDSEGSKHTLKGQLAVFVRAWFHAAESLRGMARQTRKDGTWRYTDEQIRKAAEMFRKITGRDSIGVAPLSKSEVDDAQTLEELRALVKARGLVGNA